MVFEKFEELAETITLRRNQGLEAALVVVRSDRGKEEMDQIRTNITTMYAEEQALLLLRQDQTAKIGTFISIVEMIGFLFLIVVGYYGFQQLTKSKDMGNNQRLGASGGKYGNR